MPQGRLRPPCLLVRRPPVRCSPAYSPSVQLTVLFMPFLVCLPHWTAAIWEVHHCVHNPWAFSEHLLSGVSWAVIAHWLVCSVLGEVGCGLKAAGVGGAAVRRGRKSRAKEVSGEMKAR